MHLVLIKVACYCTYVLVHHNNPAETIRQSYSGPSPICKKSKGTKQRSQTSDNNHQRY